MNSLKERIHTVIFGTDTPAGQRFDVILIYAILLSVFVVILDSISALSKEYRNTFYGLEWFFTILFTVEYALRITVSPKPWRYVFSFYGIVDLLSILPSYLALLFPGTNHLLIIRLLRVMRVFRVLKLLRYLSEANLLARAVLGSRRKISVFFLFVMILATVFGCLMFVVEGPQYGFTSIPKSIYWAIVTITTVGYGDITPITPFGQFVATLLMLTGYSVIAVPTGIFTAEIAQEMQIQRDKRRCQACGQSGHEQTSTHCRHCGAELP